MVIEIEKIIPRYWYQHKLFSNICLHRLNQHFGFRAWFIACRKMRKKKIGIEHFFIHQAVLREHKESSKDQGNIHIQSMHYKEWR